MTVIKKETCESLVDQAMCSRLTDLDLYFNGPTLNDVRLGDNGTLDTVLYVDDEEYLFNDTSAYRDDDNSTLDLAEFWESSECDDIRDEMRERFYEYGLCFDYVAPDTFKGQEQAYFVYQISYGGPSESFRFYVNPDLSCYRIEFWYLDWFDGACRTCTNEQVLKDIWQDWLDYELPQSKIKAYQEE